MRILFSISIVILLILSGCSSTPTLELIRSTVDIRDDKSGEIGITTGDLEGEFIQLISLSYEFILKNTGRKTLGGAEKPNSETFEFDDGIKLIIEPNETLTAITEAIVGFNIFSEEGRAQAYLGMGKTAIPVLKPNEEGKYTFNFVLGASKENPEMRIAPSQDQLDELLKNAMDASLVIYIEEEEIARFDLSNED